jgi:hypothetical protein
MRSTTTSLLAAAILTLWAAAAPATTIVAIKTGDDVYIGADSKVLIEKDVAISQCKITKMGNAYLVFSGTPSLPAAGFNAYGIAAAAFDGAGSITAQMDAFDAAVSGKLRDAFEHMRKKEPKTFAKWYAPDVTTRIALQVMVAGAEPKGTLLSMLEYRIDSPREKPVTIKTVRQNIVTAPGSKKPKILILGMQDAIQELLQRSDYFTHFDPVTSIRDWIGEQARVEPTKVGPPVDILRIGPQKAQWVQHKEMCPEIDPPAASAAADAK